MTRTKSDILSLLDRFVRQRPGLDYANYGSLSTYRSEVRQIGRDLQDARALMLAVAADSSITADDLSEAFISAYSGRLSLTDDGLTYCAGQYWPTEYRRAACAVLADAIWRAARRSMPEPVGRIARQAAIGSVLEYDVLPYRGRRVTYDEYRQAVIRDRFGRGMQRRWF